MPSATGDTEASETMRAWKFLERGRVAPFGGHVWPAPGGAAPGEWIQPPGGEVFACRITDLAWWVNAELWEVELEGPIRTLATQIVGRRGRLLRRSAGWDDVALRAYAVACAERARDLTVSILVHEGRSVDAETLRQAHGPLELHRVSQALATDARTPGTTMVGYLAAAAMRAAEGAGAAAAHHAADAAAIADGTPGALEREIAWQARWIAERAGLSTAVVAAV
jgi:hypothetical protein